MSEGAEKTHVSVDRAGLEALKKRLHAERSALQDLGRGMPPTRGVDLARRASDLVDGIILELAEAAARAVDLAHGPTARRIAGDVAIVPVGGYGRRELCPRSDIDLLFLLPSGGERREGEAPPGVTSDPSAGHHVAAYVNAILYGLWDLGFEVGHAVRTVEECIAIAAQDQAVKTGLLDARLLVGRNEEASTLRIGAHRALAQAIERELLSGSGANLLIEQKLEESRRRRERFGNSIYLLEPNVKAGEGGLRELHTALWIARARWRAVGVEDLLRFSVVSPREAKALERAHGFLLRVRTELHLASGRRQDMLGFEYQEAIAQTLGYLREGSSDDDKRKRGVERFMRAYYFHARQLKNLGQRVIERATSHPQLHPAHVQKAPRGFKLWGGTLTVQERDQFQKDPAALVRIFRVAQEEALEIYSYTKELIHGSLGLIDRRVRRQPEVVADFLALLEDPKSSGAILDVMHDLGVLRRLIPEVARVTARWQYSLYHVYTVDIHSLFVVKNLKMLRRGDFARDQPELTRLASELPRPSVLYMAAFLHDIGKGWDRGDHSERGALIAGAVGKRFEEAGIPSWTAEDTVDLVWLVREHLAMSNISQRRDVSDGDLIESFAHGCGTVERLTMLYLLTFADMKGTSPKVWSDWKATLLREVYEVTRAVLSSPERGALIGRAVHVEARRGIAMQEILKELVSRGLTVPSREVVQAFAEAMPERYMLSVPVTRMLRHVEMWREVSQRGGLAVHIRHLRREGTTKLTIVCPDRPGLLSILAGTLAANRLQILSAQIFSIDLMAVPIERDSRPLAERAGSITGRDESLAYHLVPSERKFPTGRAALDVLFLKDENGGICEDPERWARLRDDLRAVVLGEAEVKSLLEQRLRGSTLKERPKPAVKTEIVIANDVSKTETVIDVFCQDRLGVLYTISRALADAGLTISVAKISTQGDRVADGFYVTDALSGRKIDDRARLESIKVGVRAAIEAAQGR